jgi:hypothetical protein
LSATATIAGPPHADGRASRAQCGM